MKQGGIETLAILPSKMKTKTPTWNNISNFFRNVHLSIILQRESIISSSVKGVTDLHGQVLQLLEVPEFIIGISRISGGNLSRHKWKKAGKKK